tara:strand:- start:65983 stop:66216 length:234 start_codon:yes stop_codon:yes gene_type:complete
MTIKEITEMQHIVKTYREMYSQYDLMQLSIESLVEKRDKLFEEAEEMQKKEKDLMNRLIKKYGANEVTPNKLLKYLE